MNITDEIRSCRPIEILANDIKIYIISIGLQGIHTGIFVIER